MRKFRAWHWMAAIAATAAGAAGLALAGGANEPVRSPQGTGRVELLGVNLASGEFAPERVPGTHGKDYVYPTSSTAKPFSDAGFNVVRVPVLWERLQPAATAPLDRQELQRLDASLAGLRGYRMVILDLHNYGRYRGAVLDGDNGAAALADFWIRIARHYQSSPHIAFGLMNEPHGISARKWRRIVDGALAKIRAAGARNLVLVPGTRWTGAHSWSSGPDSNAQAFAGFRDPGNNFMFEVHQYFDQDSSGQSPSCQDKTVGSRRLAQFTRWARREKARALLGEFGAGTDPVCLAALDDMLKYMSWNADVWAGGTYWAAGEWWGDYPFSVQPPSGQGPRPQMRVLMRYVAPKTR
jgi:endoglucanase